MTEQEAELNFQILGLREVIKVQGKRNDQFGYLCVEIRKMAERDPENKVSKSVLRLMEIFI